jgi:hypothetical protein
MGRGYSQIGNWGQPYASDTRTPKGPERGRSGYEGSGPSQAGPAMDAPELEMRSSSSAEPGTGDGGQRTDWVAQDRR